LLNPWNKKREKSGQANPNDNEVPKKKARKSKATAARKIKGMRKKDSNKRGT